MIIIEVDFHPEFEQIASVDTESGDFEERRLQHPEEAERFYRELGARGVQVRVGMEASGHARWFERLLPSCSLSCGSEMPPRFEPREYANKRRIGKTRNYG